MEQRTRLGNPRVAASRGEAYWIAIPVVAIAAAAISIFAARGFEAVPGFAVPWLALELAILIAAVFASVHHADVIAHRTGEPHGTLVLTVTVTVIEVALILSIMLVGDGYPTLVRDTVFAVVMIVCNGLVGLCLVADCVSASRAFGCPARAPISWS